MAFPPVLTEEYWKESQFSIARYYGGININGHEYIIVDKFGTDIYTLSEKAEREGRQKAIEPGEPCDLVRKDFIPTYKWLGRDKVIELLKAETPISEIKEQAKKLKYRRNGRSK